eukprot:scaffold82187_cov35-Prasinocladus_malaysianus.AAC.1
MLSHRSDELCFLARIVNQLDLSKRNHFSRLEFPSYHQKTVFLSSLPKLASRAFPNCFGRQSDMILKPSATSCHDMASSLATDKKVSQIKASLKHGKMRGISFATELKQEVLCPQVHYAGGAYDDFVE